MLADISMFGPMVLVELPCPQTSTGEQVEATYSDAEKTQNMLFHDHAIEVSAFQSRQ